ncbi:hypothetical protein BDZ89DRAFT_1127025 [Hymenopellis radicata]|nr:hypothetical protein BDZ89DRAFT_1127025 [Hymenopellis radicata]
MFVSLIISATAITSLKLDRHCSLTTLSNTASQFIASRISLSSHVSRDVTSISIGLTDAASRRDLFWILHLFHQSVSWIIRLDCFDVGPESSASVAPLVTGIAPTVEYLKLTLNDCSSPTDVLSLFHHLTVITQLSISINERMMPHLTNALLSLPKPSDLTRLRLEICLHIQLQRNDWFTLGCCIASRRWIFIMDLQSLFIQLPTPVAAVRWQSEAFSVRRLLNENEDVASSDPPLEVQSLMPFPKREPYYPPQLTEHDEFSTEQMSDMVQQDASLSKLRCVVIATTGIQPILAYISVPNFDAAIETLENSSVRQYVRDAYLTPTPSHSTLRLKYIHRIMSTESSGLYVAVCPIQELCSLNLKNDIASSYLHSVSSADDRSFENWTGNIVILRSQDEVLTDASEADFLDIEAELPRFLKWYMVKGRFEL